ncbi:MAG: hypothetical protein K2X27_10435 [Candidatus Obscuribacterales bacterium]|nr:hypothetical protein [Candidatus Obscuribacterales bacterium]
MKLIAGSLCLFLGINLIFQAACEARFAVKQTRQVPINRLLKNLEYQRADAMNSTDKAMVDFQIGRLHSMAYAQQVELAACDSAAIPGSKYELPDFGHTPDHIQFALKDKYKKNAAADVHLKLAIQNLQAAIKTDPGLMPAKLGLAWCLEQSGNKASAKTLYKEVFASTYKDERDSKGGMYNWSISLEAAKYLKPLLDPQKDKKELDDLDKCSAEIQKLPRYITPILVPLTKENNLKALLVSKKVRFDLDGFGAANYGQWVSNKAAWLVFDTERNGKIDSGLKLVGQSSFWLFWRNGYDVLRSLDDNHDGKLSGAELRTMALWQDKNANGISDAGELKALEEYKIRALKFNDSRDKNGTLCCKQGVLYTDGSSAASWDVMLRKIPDRPNKAKQILPAGLIPISP